MRLGKSLAAVRWTKQRIKESGYEPETVYNRTHRVLVVAPVTTLQDWERELKFEGIDPKDIHWLLGSSTKRMSISNPLMKDAGWFFVNYEGLRACPELFKHNWFTVIMDESTKLRNPQAQITKLCVSEFAYVKNAAILSGLPAPESPMDYFSQFHVLHGGFMGYNNFWAWRLRYFAQGPTGWDWYPKKGTIDALKGEVHRLAFVMTRKEAKIGPKKIYERRYVYMNAPQKKMYAQVEKEFEFRKEESGELVQTKWNLERVYWLSRIAGGFFPDKEEVGSLLISEEKLKELHALITEELKNDKIVVWFRYNAELKAAAQYLTSKGIKCGQVYGDIPLEERKHATDSFRASIRIMLAQVKCAKFGLDWSVASTAIYYSNSYDMEDRGQSEDRIVHPKKVEPVLYIDLVTKDTIDEEVIESLKEKYITTRIFMTKFITKLREKWAVIKDKKSRRNA
jgi:SNF2 family DNA or RNA helicase